MPFSMHLPRHAGVRGPPLAAAELPATFREQSGGEMLARGRAGGEMERGIARKHECIVRKWRFEPGSFAGKRSSFAATTFCRCGAFVLASRIL